MLIINANKGAISPFIVGIPAPILDSKTREILAKLNPIGYILFKRNCKNPQQLQALCTELAKLSPTTPPLIFIDQEGGRVNRIDWEIYTAPPAQKIGEIYAKNPEKGLQTAKLNGYLIASQLANYGITVDCLPVADIAFPKTDKVIGDRAFSTKKEAVAALCAATISGLLAGGVWPVIKHAPGHGRATADSHKELPIVNASTKDLSDDFYPFAKNNKAPFVMTAHVLYTALDKENCATQSTYIVEKILREKIGFRDSIIISDDICMEALKGDIAERASNAIKAGCDLILHCNGKLEEMQQLIDIAEVSPQTLQRLQNIPDVGKPNQELFATSLEEMQILLKNI